MKKTNQKDDIETSTNETEPKRKAKEKKLKTNQTFRYRSTLYRYNKIETRSLFSVCKDIYRNFLSTSNDHLT